MEAVFPQPSDTSDFIATHIERLSKLDTLKDWSIVRKKSKQHARATEERIQEIDAIPLENRSVAIVMYALELASLIRNRDEASQELEKLQQLMSSPLSLEQAEEVARNLDNIESRYNEQEIVANDVLALVTDANCLYSQYQYAQEQEIKQLTEKITPDNNTVLHVLRQMANRRPTPDIGPLIYRQSQGIVRTLIAGELGLGLPIPPSALESV